MNNRTELDSKLISLNNAVTDAIAKRTAWMDAHMADYARYPIGTELFNMDTGARLGTVSEYYRYWGGRDPQYDTSMTIEYKLNVRDNMYDNTSRHGGSVWFGSREELSEHLRSRAEYLESLGQDGKVDWAKVFAGK